MLNEYHNMSLKLLQLYLCMFPYIEISNFVNYMIFKKIYFQVLM